MTEITNEHRIGGLEARIANIEAAHFRHETKIEQRLDRIDAKLDDLSGTKLVVMSFISLAAWLIGIATPIVFGWFRAS